MCIRMISLSYIKEIFIKKIDIIMENQVNVMPRIGEKAPSFEAVTTQGKINFPSDYAGKWIILFSHPADFTPVCTSEFMTFGKMSKEFEDFHSLIIDFILDSTKPRNMAIQTVNRKSDQLAIQILKFF